MTYAFLLCLMDTMEKVRACEELKTKNCISEDRQ